MKCLVILLTCPWFMFAEPAPGSEGRWSGPPGNRGAENTAVRGSYVTFDVNTISTYIRNNGSFNRNPTSGGAGFEWPRGTGNTAIYASGLWLGGKRGDTVCVAVAEYGYEYDAGPIAPGVNPDDVQWKVYKIKSGDNAANSTDYASWPWQDGAPVVQKFDGSGDSLDGGGNRIPLLLGNMTAWAVFNDANPLLHTRKGTPPLGLEIQLTAFGFNRSDALVKTVFYIWKVINKSGTALDSTHAALWCDADIGDSGDDFDGCDTLRGLGYTYNADGFDAVYGSTPPASGFVMLQGPLVPGGASDTASTFDGRRHPGMRTLRMSSYLKYTNDASDLGNPATGREVLNYMKGRTRSGEAVLDPLSHPTPYMFPGDPTLPYDAVTNWIESGTGSDRRFLMSTGPFTMASGDTQVIVAANMIAQGNSHLASVAALRAAGDFVRQAYESLLRTGVINLHSVVVQTQGQGSVQPPGPVPVADGGEVALTFTPAPGYHIDSVVVNGTYRGQMSGYTFLNVKADSLIRIVFAVNHYALSASSGLHGSIEPAGIVDVVYGGLQRFVFTADIDFEVDSVLVDSALIADSAEGYTIGPVDADHAIRVTFRPLLRTEAVAIEKGWNLLSLPFKVSDPRLDSVFPTAISHAFVYRDFHYEIEDSLEFGRGVWVKFAGSDVVELQGFVCSRDTAEVLPGWNLIGSVSVPLLVSNVISDPPGMVTSNFYDYAGTYAAADTIQPGSGYWVKVETSGTLILAAPGTASPQALIKIVPTSYRPPPPPGPETADPAVAVPRHFDLGQNYPNPFNPITQISYALPATVHVTLNVFNVLGEVVATLVDREETPGHKSVSFDATEFPSGIYFYEMQAGGFIATRKLLLVR